MFLFQIVKSMSYKITNKVFPLAKMSIAIGSNKDGYNKNIQYLKSVAHVRPLNCSRRFCEVIEEVICDCCLQLKHFPFLFPNFAHPAVFFFVDSYKCLFNRIVVPSSDETSEHFLTSCNRHVTVTKYSSRRKQILRSMD